MIEFMYVCPICNHLHYGYFDGNDRGKINRFVAAHEIVRTRIIHPTEMFTE